jgi:hypothetical protein
VVTRTALENMYKVVHKATAEFERIGQPGWSNALHEDFTHELSAWDSWYDDGEDPRERPDYSPTMRDLNYFLAKRGYKGIGGKNPRVVKL